MRSHRVIAPALVLVAACFAGQSESESSAGEGTGASTEIGMTIGDGSSDDPGVPACDDLETCDGDACVDTSTNAMHCGRCDNACPNGITCSDGQCDCPEDTIACAQACVDPLSNVAHCGRCGHACNDGFVCFAGQCVDDCGDLGECGGGCVDTQSHPLHCGECDNACGSGTACVTGSCVCTGEVVSFASQVAPILEARCTAMGCHGSPASQEGLDLRSRAAYDDLVGVASSQCGDRLLVAPGMASESYLVDKLVGVDLCAGTMMPKNPPALSTAEIDLIATWICHGAPNN